MRATHYISAFVLGVFLIFGGIVFPLVSSAQSAENNCELPDFQISSDDQVYALTGESFSYYVVTDTDAPYSLSSGLPSGLNFAGDQIYGTPQVAGDFTLEFTASNECGVSTQVVNLTVVDSSSAVAQGSAEQAANVGLNEIPDTGLEADSALTISFYVLSLLLIAGWFTRKMFTPATASVGGGTGTGRDFEDEEPAQSFAAVMRGSFIPRGQSMVSETVRKTEHRTEKKSEPVQSQKKTFRFGDGIRRP